MKARRLAETTSRDMTKLSTGHLGYMTFFFLTAFIIFRVVLNIS